MLQGHAVLQMWRKLLLLLQVRLGDKPAGTHNVSDSGDEGGAGLTSKLSWWHLRNCTQAKCQSQQEKKKPAEHQKTTAQRTHC